MSPPIFVAEGDRVKKGQLVLQIDDQRLRAAVEQNEAAAHVQEIAIQRQQLQVENLRTQLERTRGLHERKLIDDDKFEAASKNLDIAASTSVEPRVARAIRAQLSQAKDHLEQDACLRADRRHGHVARHQSRRDGDLELRRTFRART